MKSIISMALVWLCVQSTAQEMWTTARPDGHAPIGVMGDHTHKKGGLMFSYRYMRMSMEGVRSGTESRTPVQITGTMMAPGSFMVSPTVMTMNMHMVGMMYAVSDNITLMVMGNYLSSSMDHSTRMGGEFTTESSGIGDSWISGLFKIHDSNSKRVHLNLGVKIPTGSFEEKDVTPASAPNETQLPYPMQPGTGTWDVKPGVTYLSQAGSISFGGQASMQIPLAKNDNDYKWGNQTSLTAWGAAKLNNYLSVSLRGRALFQGDISGEDPVYNGPKSMSMVPTVFPENFGGSWVFGGAGVNFYFPEGVFKKVRIGLEYELPVVQDINGPQMEIDGTFTLGLQYAL